MSRRDMRYIVRGIENVEEEGEGFAPGTVAPASRDSA